MGDAECGGAARDYGVLDDELELVLPIRVRGGEKVSKPKPPYVEVAEIVGWTSVYWRDDQQEWYGFHPEASYDEGPTRISRPDWSEIGPLLVRFRIGISPFITLADPASRGQSWSACEPVSKFYEVDLDPKVAACRLIARLSQAGKLKDLLS